MKKIGIVAGITAVLGSGGLLLSTVLPSHAAGTTVAQNNIAVSAQAPSKVTFANRYFFRSERGYHARALLPKQWKHVRIGFAQDRFQDTKRGEFIRFDFRVADRDVSTTRLLAQKKAALKKVRGVKIQGTSTVAMTSTTGQGRLVVSTIVYTHKVGRTTRWVATRYVGYRSGIAFTEITTAGPLKDKKLLGTVINNATRSITLAG